MTGYRWRAGTAVALGFLVVASCSYERARETTLVAPVASGGEVEVLFRTPRTLEPGEERELARWSSSNRSDEAVEVWEGVAVEGLPTTCDLDVSRWEEIAPQVERGEPPTTERHELEPGEERGITAAYRRDVPSACAGDYDLVLLLMSDAFEGGLELTRVPLTIE